MYGLGNKTEWTPVKKKERKNWGFNGQVDNKVVIQIFEVVFFPLSLVHFVQLYYFPAIFSNDLPTVVLHSLVKFDLNFTCYIIKLLSSIN